MFDVSKLIAAKSDKYLEQICFLNKCLFYSKSVTSKNGQNCSHLLHKTMAPTTQIPMKRVIRPSFKIETYVNIYMRAFVCSPSASKNKIKDAHKRIMLINHPDRGKFVLQSICSAAYTILYRNGK